MFLTSLVIIDAILLFLVILGIIFRNRRLWISSVMGLIIIALVYITITSIETDKGISRKIPPSTETE